MQFKKFQRRTLVVGATQVTQADAGDYGTLGTLSSGDWIITLPSGALTTADDATLTSYYEATSDSLDLYGEDYLWL